MTIETDVLPALPHNESVRIPQDERGASAGFSITPQNILANWPILLMAVFFLGIYWDTFGFMMSRWRTDEAAQHGWLVIPIALATLWYKRHKLAALPRSSDVRGIVVMVIALMLHLSEKALDLNGPSPLSIPIFLAGAVWYFAGTQWLRTLAFPIAYLIFMIPIPGGFTEFISFPLRLIATNLSRKIASWGGVETFGSGMYIEFMQPRGTEHVALEIADPCSGLHSVMALKALHAITAYMSRLRMGWKWALFMCAIPIALMANLCRIVSIIFIGAYINKGFAIGLWHHWSSPILFVFAFLILISIGRLLEWATGGSKPQFLVNEAAAWTNFVERAKAVAAQSPRPKPLFALSLLAACLGLSLFFTYKTPTVIASADVTRIPLQNGDWRMIRDDSTNEVTQKQMGDMKADSFITRIYQNSAGQQVQFLVVYRKYGRREFSHRPELCFPAAGYAISKNANKSLPYAHRDVPVRYLTATRPGEEETITYFFASGKKTEEDFMRQQFWMALERVIPNKNGWTFVRLTSPTRTNSADALAAQQDFMRTFAPDLERIITTDQATAG